MIRDETAAAVDRLLALHGDEHAQARLEDADGSREGSPGGNDGGRSPGSPVTAPTSDAVGRSGRGGTGPGAPKAPEPSTQEHPRAPRVVGAEPRPAPASARADSRSVARWKRTREAIARICGGAR